MTEVCAAVVKHKWVLVLDDRFAQLRQWRCDRWPVCKEMRFSKKGRAA